jgi:hypothetical protein
MEQQAANPQAQSARLLYLTQQIKQLEAEKESLKRTLEKGWEEGVVPATLDSELLFSDGSTRKVRLSRQGTGTFFKIKQEFKEEYLSRLDKLQKQYIKDGKAAMAEKSHTWVAKEIK